MILRPSPNHSGLRKKTTLIVIHSSGGSIVSNLAWLSNPDSKASCHYIVARDEEIYQLVADNMIAWHAGQSKWKGVSSCNNYSLGIELERSVKDTDYPEKQIQSLVSLVCMLMGKYSLKLEDVVGHKDVSPGRKVDPVDFDWENFRLKIEEELCPKQQLKKSSQDGKPQSFGPRFLAVLSQLLEQLKAFSRKSGQS